jgi:hypothetical protein
MSLTAVLSTIALAKRLAAVTGLDDLIASKLEGTKAAEVAAKVVDAARVVTGIADPSEAVVALETNPELAQAYRMALLDVYRREIEIEAEDRASARTREVQIVTSEAAPMFVKLVPSIIDVSIVLMTFGIFTAMIFAKIDPAARDVILYVAGVLNTALITILAYHRGSTRGSQAKNEALEAMAKRV